MKLKSASYKRLWNRDERATAHLAAIARVDTIWGGARAMRLARRMDAMGCKINADAVVGEVYRRSTGKWSHDLEAWECPECGEARLGQEAALDCCNYVNESEYQPEEIHTFGQKK